VKAVALVASLIVCLAAGCQTTGGSNKPKPQPERASDINIELAVDYMRKGDLAQAKEKIERSVEQNPKNAKAHATAGFIFSQLRDTAKADEHYSRAVALDPKNPETLNNYAVFLCQNGKYEKGEKFALEAAANPLYKTPEAGYVNAGDCARDGGNAKRAEENYRKALASQPKFGAALYRLAEIELKNSRYLPARAFYERYVALGRMNASTLWLGYRIERALNNQPAMKNYSQRLKVEYTSSSETKQLLELEKNKG
jgi:type IV pilus assembly protein PilF